MYSLGKDDENKVKLSIGDVWASNWYLFNGFFYHMILDAFGGSFLLIPMVVQQYQVLDKRFINHHPVPWSVGVIELFFMAPLCFATHIAIKQGWSSRYPLEIVVSVAQFIGMLVFMIAEVYEGQLNVIYIYYYYNVI